jgi:hypothetical protein
MYQRCPICQGDGNIYPPVGYAVICPTCKGKRIISDVTGKPPHEEGHLEICSSAAPLTDKPCHICGAVK